MLSAAAELRPGDNDQAESLAMVVSQVFKKPALTVPVTGATTLVEALHEGITRQLAKLDDRSLTGTGRSSAEVLGVRTQAIAETLTGHLIREIIGRAARGGPLEPLAAQINHDFTHLQSQQLKEMVENLTGQVRDTIGRPQLAQATPPSSLEVRYSLPPDPLEFTGREEELKQIMSDVLPEVGSSSVVAIHAIDGMPGVGKTTLAVHAAHLLRLRFPDRQLFINLHGHTPGQEPLTPQTALAGLLSATGVDARNLPDGLEERTALWRDRMVGQRVLLVLDNAASSVQVLPLLLGGRSLTLVTSRRHLGDLPAATPSVALEVLPPDRAREMFVRLATRSAADPAEALSGIVQLAGYLPLAISLLARLYVRHPSWKLADLAAETRTGMLTLAAERDCVAAAFEVSYRHLAPGRQQAFRALGMHLGTELEAYACGALLGISELEAGPELDALQGEGLLTEVGYRRYAMHDLIRRYARDLAAADPAIDRGEALSRLLDYYQRTAARADDRLTRQARFSPVSERAGPSAAVPVLADMTQSLAWARAERANLLACLNHVIKTEQNSRIIAFAAAVAALLQQDGPWTDAIAYHSAAVRAADCVGDRFGRAAALVNLGEGMRLMGNYRGAITALQEALAICRDIGDRLGEANALTALGEALRLTGDTSAAVSAQEESLAICRDVGQLRGQASALIGLGTILWMTGNYRRAESVLQEAQAITRDTQDQRGHANALNDLAAVWRRTGDYQRALGALEEALIIHRDIGDRHGQANALFNLGNVARRMGDYPGAARALDEALDIALDLGDRLDQANALNQLGNVRRATGDYAGAARALDEALTITRDIGNRRGEANALTYLGSVRRLEEDYSGAIAALEDALDILSDLNDGGGQAEVLNEEGTVHRLSGDLARAEACHRRALHLASAIASPSEEAHALAGLGRCALASGRIGDATAGLREAERIFHRIGAAEAVSVSAELGKLIQDSGEDLSAGTRTVGVDVVAKEPGRQIEAD